MTTPEPVLLRGVRPLGTPATDLLLVNGLIAGLGADLDVPSGTTVIDAGGAIVLPGLVDLHTHLREPGREDAETIATGSAAAALGGFTAVHAMANTTPVADTAEIVEQVFRLGRAAGLVDVRPVGAVSRGLAGEQLAEIGNMARSAAGVRVFSDDGHCVHDSRLMRRALEYIRPFDAVLAQHAQDPRLADSASCAHEGEVSGRLGLAGWPAVAEESIIARDVMLTEHTGSRLHICHVSTAGSVEVIRWAKARGIAVTAEVTPHHLMLTCDLLTGYDPVYKVNPPLRTDSDVEALRAGLADGTIDAVATDHAPHAQHDKDHAFPDAAFGMMGLETALGVVVKAMVETGRLDWAGVADRMSVRPAVIGRLAGHGRPIAVGEPANLTLLDPDATWQLPATGWASLSRNSPFASHTLPGRVLATFLRGRPTVLEGRLMPSGESVPPGESVRSSESVHPNESASGGPTEQVSV
jgi:dihydroorotase